MVRVYEALRSFRYVSMPPSASIQPSTRASAVSSAACVGGSMRGPASGGHAGAAQAAVMRTPASAKIANRFLITALYPPIRNDWARSVRRLLPAPPPGRMAGDGQRPRTAWCPATASAASPPPVPGTCPSGPHTRPRGPRHPGKRRAGRSPHPRRSGRAGGSCWRSPASGNPSQVGSSGVTFTMIPQRA